MHDLPFRAVLEKESSDGNHFKLASLTMFSLFSSSNRVL